MNHWSTAIFATVSSVRVPSLDRARQIIVRSVRRFANRPAVSSERSLATTERCKCGACAHESATHGGADSGNWKRRTMRDAISIGLTHDEALVLFEWLARESDQAASRLTFEDQAEQVVLWRLEGLLENQLEVLTAPDYADLSASARNAITGTSRG